MNKSLALFTAAALWPAAAFAQTPAPGEPPATPVPVRALARVEFQDADLPAIIEYLKEQNEHLGGNQRDLNIILSPGIEKLRVPMLSLRNVTVNDVLTIATTVLNVQLEPVANQTTGDTVAWIVRAPDPNMGAAAGAAIGAFVPAPGAAPTPPGPVGASDHGAGATSSEPGVLPPHAPATVTPGQPAGDVIQFNPGPGGAPHVIELASGGGGGLIANNPLVPGSAPAPRPSSKVFGIASLLHSSSPDPKQRQEERAVKFSRLISSLQDLTNDQGHKADVKAYDDMAILIVKSEDPEALRLVTDVIDALKQNAASDRADAGQPSKNDPQKPGAH